LPADVTLPIVLLTAFMACRGQTNELADLSSAPKPTGESDFCSVDQRRQESNAMFFGQLLDNRLVPSLASQLFNGPLDARHLLFN
jgi:hypothetical protein